MSRGHIEGIDRAQTGGEHHHVPHLYDAGVGEGGEAEGLGHGKALSDQEDLPLADAVGDDARGEAEHQHGEGGTGADDTQHEGGIGEV